MRRKIVWGIGIAALLAAIFVGGWLRFRQPDFSHRVYRMGWVSSPPFQLRGADGQPAGLAVDLVREAARRRGIALKWIYWNDSSESALRRNAVDLWPLITITPDRLKFFHISEPYIETEHCLLVRADGPYRKFQDLATATIGLANTPIDLWHMQHSLPEAHPLVHPLLPDVMADVCSDRVDAAFMDAYTAISLLLANRSCDGHSLRWISAPEVRSRFGVGATFEARDAADAIREEIGNMAGEGKFGGNSGAMGVHVGPAPGVDGSAPELPAA